ncbi:hypothetical protein PAE9249_01862 [Paenibacillus sp. CECT 9249]|nr:hypothetical protein PAE9249_01862 [Paenibacillus sp. CECT 9249]
MSGLSLKVKITKLKVDGQWVDAKMCLQCKTYKPLDHFHNEKHGIGGKKAKCKKCRQHRYES